ncbi:MAG: ABC transporter ATP-binding protein [Saprospiraceae bacterium]|nr:ABC transporter ATP-binding protein [Saprospiraceae bacterium]
MEVSLENISKRFGYQWIIRDCNYQFPPGSITGISGMNGSGKSTLIKIISSHLSPTEGKVKYNTGDKRIGNSDIYKHLSMVGPYTGLIGEYNIEEQYGFHFKFKNKVRNLEFQEFREWLELDIHPAKRIMDYSSGMHQRLQLGIALQTDVPLLLLDEPTSFLDNQAKGWFYRNLESMSADKTIIIASNDMEDFNLCGNMYDVMELKTIS